MFKIICFFAFATLSQLTLAADVTRNCKVNQVFIANSGAASSDRVHVRCATGTIDSFNTIFFYALPLNSGTKDAATATQLVNLGNTAFITGKQLSITFRSGDTSGTAYGCRNFDCRKPKAISIQ